MLSYRASSGHNVRMDQQSDKGYYCASTHFTDELFLLSSAKTFRM